MQAKRAAVLIGAADLAQIRGDDARAKEWVEQGLAAARASGDPAAIAEAVFFLGADAQRRGEAERADALLTEALARWRELGEPAWTTGALGNLGYVAHEQGDLDRAAAYFIEALELGQAVGFGWGVLHAQRGLGFVAWDRADYRQAAAQFADALSLAHTQRDVASIADVLVHLANCVGASGSVAAAVRLLGAAASLRETLNVVLVGIGHERAEQTLAAAHAALGPNAVMAEWEAGRALSLEQAVAEGLAVARLVASSPPASKKAEGPNPHGLSPREQEVLRLIASRLLQRPHRDDAVR